MAALGPEACLPLLPVFSDDESRRSLVYSGVMLFPIMITTALSVVSPDVVTAVIVLPRSRPPMIVSEVSGHHS